MARRPVAVRATATATIGGGDGAVRLDDVRSEPPLSLRRSGGRLLVVGSAAGPVGGDELHLHLRITPGTCVSIGTAAATILWPGPAGERSTSTVTIDVGIGADVEWAPCPTVSVRGSNHRSLTLVRLAPGARCRVVEEIVLGRGDEEAGTLDASIRIERDELPVVHHREQFGQHVPGWGSTTSVGSARFVHQEFRVGRPARESRATVADACAAAMLAIADDVVAILATARDRPTAQAVLGGWR